MKIRKILFAGAVLFAAGLLSACSNDKEGLSSLAIMALLNRPNTSAPDDTFGNVGYITYTVDGQRASGQAVAMQSDGKILVAGFVHAGSQNHDIAVWRYNSDSTIDTTFGNQGLVSIDGGASGYDYGHAVAIQDDGKILVAGSADNGSNSDMALIRLNTDGSLDSTFGSSGKIIHDEDGFDDAGNGIAIQSDGAIFVTGYTETSDIDLTVWKYNADGTPDNAFGSSGVAIRNPYNHAEVVGKSIVVGSGESILVTGYTSLTGNESSDGSMILVKLDSTGSIVFNTLYNDLLSMGNALAIQEDGKILVTGEITNGSNNDLALWRYNTDGSPDASFDSDGLLTRGNDAGGNGSDSGNSIILQSDGKILITGSSYGPDGNMMALWRFKPDGVIDTSFDSDGFTLFGKTTMDAGVAVALQSDGKIVVAGESFDDMILWRYKTDGTLDK